MKTLIGCLAALFAAYHLSVSTLDRSNLTRASLHYPGTEPPGSIETRGKGGSWGPLTPGSNGQVLTMVNGLPTWAAIPGHSHPVDGSAGTPSLRTLGTGAQQAAAGNHSHP